MSNIIRLVEHQICIHSHLKIVPKQMQDFLLFE